MRFDFTAKLTIKFWEEYQIYAKSVLCHEPATLLSETGTEVTVNMTRGQARDMHHFASHYAGLNPLSLSEDRRWLISSGQGTVRRLAEAGFEGAISSS